MPKVNDIVSIAEAMEKSPVAVVRDRCVAVRNRNASCRKCARACPFGAISVAGNKVDLNPGQCVGCGACAAACPTEALVMLKPSDRDLAASLQASSEANGGAAVVACARIASKRAVPPERFAEVPCLARIDPCMLLLALSGGAGEVLVVDGDCATCKHRGCVAALDAALDETRRIIEAHGSDARITRMTGFPEEMKAEEGKASQYGATRRGFFSEAIDAAKETTMTAARVTLAQDLGNAQAEAAIGERLRVSKDGKLPTIRAARHEAALNAMDVLGEPADVTLATSLFGTVDIDLSKCNACGMCVTFCPTAALVRDPVDKATDPIKYLEFSACDCIQCSLCGDVCWKGALSLSSEVALSEIYDFEPRTFDLSRLNKRANRFGG